MFVTEPTHLLLRAFSRASIFSYANFSYVYDMFDIPKFLSQHIYDSGTILILMLPAEPTSPIFGTLTCFGVFCQTLKDFPALREYSTFACFKGSKFLSILAYYTLFILSPMLGAKTPPSTFGGANTRTSILSQTFRELLYIHSHICLQLILRPKSDSAHWDSGHCPRRPPPPTPCPP